MDLPLHPVDIYQIQRTPFFRLLHRKDSAEFERLKEAYDSVRNFDDKPLVAQVKKIRLGKLLRRIKDTLSSKGNLDNKPRPKAKTKQQIRREELAKARQMGDDYSRNNFVTPMPWFTIHDKGNALTTWKKEKSRLERRLEYGNTKSLVNRNKIQRSQRMNLEKSIDESQLHTGNTTLITKDRIEMMKKKLSKEEFMKFLIHCLSDESPNPDVMKSFEDILESKNDLYWDVVEAIELQKQYIQRYARSVKKLTNLAEGETPQPMANSSAHCIQNAGYAETFNSKTNIKPAYIQIPEVFIRTYRYTDDDEFLPPPSESMLKIPEDLSESTEDIPERDGFYSTIDESIASSSPIPKQTSNHVSAKVMKSLGISAAAKNMITQKFGDIIREAVRRESAAMLPNLTKALKH